MNWSIKKYVLVCISLFVWCTSAFAGTIMFENANQLYRSKNYLEAADLYMQIINDGYGSGSVYYNAGNAFYKSNKIGYAIWCYQKALQYQTDTKIISENLMLAKKKLAGKQQTENEFSFFKKVQELLNYFPLNKWAFYTWVLFMLVLLTRALRLFKNAPLFLIGLRKLFSTAFIFCFGIMLSNYFLNKYNKLAIVVENAAMYRTENANGKGYDTLPEGTQVIIKENQSTLSNDKQKIKLPNGNICWVYKSSIRKF
jgi:tetratricopeptide (TPR) repeat protein